MPTNVNSCAKSAASSRYPVCEGSSVEAVRSHSNFRRIDLSTASGLKQMHTQFDDYWPHLEKRFVQSFGIEGSEVFTSVVYVWMEMGGDIMLRRKMEPHGMASTHFHDSYIQHFSRCCHEVHATV